MNKYPKLCRDCKWALDRKEVTVRCVNPIVNANDAYALSSGHDKYRGTLTTNERMRGWFSPCGKTGKQWEPLP